jgi:predicted permease
MPNFILLIICFCAGMALRRSGKFPENAHVTLNSVIIYLSLPALILMHLHGLIFSRELLYAAAMPWCLFLIGACLFFVAGRRTHLRLESMAALTLVGGLGNTSFVGIPMVEALHGEDGVPLAVIIDQMTLPLHRKSGRPSKLEAKTAKPELLTCMSGASANNRIPVR